MLVFLRQHVVHDVVQIDTDEALRLDAGGRITLQRVFVVSGSVTESQVRRDNIFRIAGIRFRGGRFRHGFVSYQYDRKLRGEMSEEGRLSPFSFPDRSFKKGAPTTQVIGPLISGAIIGIPPCTVICDFHVNT